MTLAGHLYKMEQTKSYFAAAGLAFGTYRWYETMAVSRYPFYLPKPEDINPNKFMFVKGPLASYSRHSWRFLLYAFISKEVGQILGQVIAQPTAARNTAQDPKLAQFATDLRAAISIDTQNGRDGDMRQRTERNPTQRNPDGSPVQQLPPHAGAPRPWRTTPKPPAPMPTVSDDDMSPTSSNDPWTSQTESFDDARYSPEATDIPQRQQRPQRPQHSQPFDPFAQQPGHSSSDDDASPTGGMFQDEVENQSRPGESAWERLRRAGGSPPGQRPPPRKQDSPYRPQKEGSTLGDSFAFSETDEERKRAQERAQREFNERIERERQGRDFNDERRW